MERGSTPALAGSGSLGGCSRAFASCVPNYMHLECVSPLFPGPCSVESIGEAECG